MGWNLSNWLRVRRSTPSQTPHARAPMRPVIEKVEDRTLLSTAHFITKFHDGNFQASNWSIVLSNVGGGGLQDAERDAKGGHPGAYRTIFNTVFGSSSGSVVYGFNAYRLGSYNPALKGAINSIAYSEDSKLIAGFGEGEATGAALIQNGVVYFAPGLITPKTAWTHQTKAKLTAANFVASDLKTHPDFSQAGAPIQFGFYRGNSTGASTYSIASSIDNWSLTVKSTRVTTKK